MLYFAIYENNEIINAIIAENKQDAINAVGENIIECNNKKPWIGWKKYDDGTWRPERPFPSWDQWDDDKLEWYPLQPKPDVPCLWDEENTCWIIVGPPFPSWQAEGNEWVAPVPYPNDGKRYIWDEDTQQWILQQE